MQTVSADARVPEPTPENLGIPEGLKRSSLNIEALEEFAQNMAEGIIQSFLRPREVVEPEVSSSDPDQEMPAEELASAVIDITVRDARSGSSGLNMDQEKVAFVDKRGKDLLDMDAQTEPVKGLQASRDDQPCHPPLSQSGLPVVGSLDYPDAPPTTPLLPELEQSRRSFARKLKGGLAKVFLPSPPPPTPKDDSDDAIDDPHVELMEHLMHSLTTDDLARDIFDMGPQRGATVEAFAEALSCDIIDWVLSAKNREELGDDGDLHLLADQLAETIITSSLGEAKMLV